MSYVYKVKCTFDHQPDVYPYFISILKEFKSNSIDRTGVIRKVLPLFKDYPGLIEEFYTFLPPGWTVQHTSPIQHNTPMHHQTVSVPQQMQFNGNNTTPQVNQQSSQLQYSPPIQQNLSQQQLQYSPPMQQNNQSMQYSNQMQYCSPMPYATPIQQQYTPMTINNIIN